LGMAECCAREAKPLRVISWKLNESALFNIF